MNNAETTLVKTAPQVNLTENQTRNFWSKVDKTTTPDGCWPWTGYRDDKGYGRAGISYRVYFAHRISFFLSTGKWPAKKLVCHHCDNPPCCNPNHLYAGTHKANTCDAIKRGRTAKGNKHGSRTHPERVARGNRHASKIYSDYMPKGEEVWCSVLTEYQVKEIKELWKSGKHLQKEIAAMFNTRQGNISRIVNGKRWKHI